MAYTSPSSLSDSTSSTLSDVESLLSAEFYTGRNTNIGNTCVQQNIMYHSGGYYQWPVVPKQMHQGPPQILHQSPQHSPMGIHDNIHNQHHQHHHQQQFDSAMIPPEGSDVLALLSSSSYPVQQSLPHNLPRNIEPLDVQPWGGYYVEPQPQQPKRDFATLSPASTEQEEPAPQKRKSSQKSDCSSTTSQNTNPTQKKRGRPRMAVDGVLDDQPEERRRAQIRIAQRAYRYRARETLVKNKARVERLEDTIKQMEQTMLKFGQKLEDSGIDLTDDLQCDLQKMTDTCQSLAANVLSQKSQELAEDNSPEAD